MSASPAPAPSSETEAARTVEVRLFGPQARLVSADRIAVNVSADATLAELRTALAKTCEPLRSSLRNSRFAVDHEYAADGDPIPPDAEVALIGLVSGG